MSATQVKRDLGADLPPNGMGIYMRASSEAHGNYMRADAILRLLDASAASGRPHPTGRRTSFMLQLAPSSSLPMATASADRADAGWCDSILSFAGVVTGSHALVISQNGLDLMCRLLRCGCAAVTTLKPSERVNGETYGLVLASSIVSTGTAGGLVHQAKRALLPGGRFLAVVPAASTAANPSAPAMLARLLKADGFIRIGSRPMRNGLMVRADLPKQDAFPDGIRLDASAGMSHRPAAR